MRKHGIVLVVAAFFVMGCAQAPSKVRNPTINLTYDETDSAKPGIVTINARIYNESDSIVFTGYQADLVLAFDGVELVRGRSQKVDIYPFSGALVTIVQRFTKDEFANIAKKLGVSANDVDKLKDAQPVFLNEGQLTLRKITCTKTNLIDILKGSGK
jgi:hypothetical protein